MSIVVTVKVGEGLVLAADSATSIILPTAEGPRSIGNIFNHTRKLLHLKDFPIGILTWGLGTIGPRSIESLIKEFEESKPSLLENLSSKCDPDYNYQVDRIATELHDFMMEKYVKAYGHIPIDQRVPVGFYVGGFSRGGFFADEYAFLIPFDEKTVNIRPNLNNGEPNFGANWFGLTDAIVRFFKGYDEKIREPLKNKGVSDTDFSEIVSPLEYKVMFNGMPLQDAIDFAVSLVQMTIVRYRYVIGAPVCGGAVDVAVITNRYFNWVKRKSWQINY